jgi:alpha-L-rhamnosidase
LHLFSSRRNAIVLSLCIASFSAAGPLPPSRLRCEYLKNPEAVDIGSPRFAWVLNHTDRAQKQTAYELQVSKDPRFTGESMWATGKVAGPQSIQVAYKGQPLSSDADYFWRVRYWDAAGAESAWSETARFSTGLMQPSDWKQNGSEAARLFAPAST